ncbi:MAG: LacI family DNA-binding transcriptional regulator [Anaerolinea sp.]|nr:LacI family DNA-binding transcriptional regulator [Anaerolinea sp.]
MNAKITVKQISEMSGVSISTVSRVLNNHHHVRPEIRNRVQQVIAETGYQPNPAARSLAGCESRIIGLVIPETTAVVFTDPYFARLIQGVAEACKHHDYTLSLFLFHTLEDEVKIASRVLSRQLLDGLILTATQIGDPLVTDLIDMRAPFVMLGHHDAPQVNYVDTDSHAGAYTAVSHLLRLGYKRIATITGPLNNIAAVKRREGYINALQNRGRAIDEALIVEADYSAAGGYTAMWQLLPQQPDAVFVASDTMAQGALQALQAAAYTVPDDIALVGYDDLPTAVHTTPPLTTIRQPIKRAGALAVTTLLDILQHGAEPARRIVLPTELVIRESCGDKRRA